MNNTVEYRSKLLSAEATAAEIADGSNISMGMVVAEPPALLKAIADRVEVRELTAPAVKPTSSGPRGQAQGGAFVPTGKAPCPRPD